MTIDREKLKALALASTMNHGPRRVETDCNGVHQVLGDGSWKILNAWHTPDGKGMSNAEFSAAASPAAILALLAEIERLELEALCPSCKGSGEAWVMSDNSPDAHHVLACCGECSGQGTLAVAHKTATTQRNAEHDRHIDLAGKIMFGNIERDKLKAENEALRKDRIDWQAECLKKGFEYVRESDDHYVLADVPEMADLLGELLGLEVRSKENDSYGETVSSLKDQVDAANDAFHRAYEAEKDNASLRGSCKAMGEELALLRKRNKSLARAVVWFETLGHMLNASDRPSWLKRIVSNLMKKGDS